MNNFLDEVHNGLSGKIKKLNPKWLYDFNGSKLFEEITKLKEYYVTRTEIAVSYTHLTLPTTPYV